MAGIPLPALAIHGPDPNQMANAFAQAIRLRQAAQAQQQNAANDAQRNDILQQDATTQAQAQQFKLQQAQLAQKNAAIANGAWQAATQGGKFDLDAFSKNLSYNGYQGDVISTAKDALAVYSAKQTAEDNAQKSQQDKESAIKSVQQQAAAITDPALADKVFMYGISKLGDAKDQQFFGSLSPQQRQGIIKSQAQIPSMNEQELAYRAAQGDKTAQAAQDEINSQKVSTKNPMAGTVNGQQAYAYPTPNGFISADGKNTPLPGFRPAPNYGQFLMAFSNPNAPTTQAAAKMIADYQMQPPSGYALSRPEGQALMAAVQQLNPNYNANGYNLAHQLISGKDGTNIGNLNTAIKHMNALDQVSAALGNQNLQVRNSVINWAATQLGGAPPVSFDALKSAVASEIASALKGNATDQEIKNAEGFINKANSPAQMHDALKNTMEIMAQKLGTYQERLDGATTGRAGMVPVLLPQSQQVLSNWGVSTQGTGLKNTGTISVKAPNGKLYNFSSQKDADAFKKAAGIR